MSKSTHQTEIESALCERDYLLLEEHHLALLSKIEAAVKDGCTPAEIKRWAQGVTSEEVILQRVYNAARFLFSGRE
jgi:hypothetical protein